MEWTVVLGTDLLIVVDADVEEDLGAVDEAEGQEGFLRKAWGHSILQITRSPAPMMGLE